MNAIFLIIIPFFFNSSVFSQEKISDPTDSPQLTTRITRQQYCDSGYPDMAQLGLSLQLTYTNVSQQTFILYRGSELVDYVLVSQDEQTAKDKRYELNMHIGWVTGGELKLAEGSKPGKEFIVLKPGQVYQTEASVSIPIGLEANSQFLKPGKHVLQVVVETWPGNEKLFGRLRKKWEKTGQLWGRNIKSDPMPIAVAGEPKIVKCK